MKYAFVYFLFVVSLITQYVMGGTPTLWVPGNRKTHRCEKIRKVPIVYAKRQFVAVNEFAEQIGRWSVDSGQTWADHAVLGQTSQQPLTICWIILPTSAGSARHDAHEYFTPRRRYGTVRYARRMRPCGRPTHWTVDGRNNVLDGGRQRVRRRQTNSWRYGGRLPRRDDL